MSVNNFDLIVAGLPPNKPGYMFYGLSQAQVPFGDGVRCIGPPFFRYQKIPMIDPSGTVVVPLDFDVPPLSNGPGQVVAGTPYYFQMWFRDPSGPLGFNTTGAICVEFAP